MCVCKCMCSRSLRLFSFFFLLLILLFFSFPEKGFFVATFCMRSILFADSNREKKIVSFLSVSLSSHSTRNLYICFLFFCTTRRKRERETESKRSIVLSVSCLLLLFFEESTRHVHVLHVYTRKKSLFFSSFFNQSCLVKISICIIFRKHQ